MYHKRHGLPQGHSLLLFEVIILPLCLLLCKTKSGYKLARDQKPPINNLLFMNDVKLYTNNNYQMESLVNTIKICSQDIRMLCGIDTYFVLEI